MLLKSRLPKSSGLTPPFADAFFRDLWTPSDAELRSARDLRGQDPEAFDARLARAVTGRDHAGSLATLQALEATQGLSLETARRLWSDRLIVQQWEAALRLLEDPAFGTGERAEDWFDLACARAAVRPAQTALQALDRALALDPQHAEALELAGELRRLLALEGRDADIGDWDRLAEFIDLLIALHRYGQAAGALGDFLARHCAGLTSSQQDQAAARVRSLCRVVGRAEAAALVQGLRPAFLARGRAEAFDWASGELTAPAGTDGGPVPDFGDHLHLAACLAQAFAAGGRWRTACRLFGPGAVISDDPFDCRLELARCVGRAAAEEARPRFTAAGARRKVVDVFPFFDELLLLQLRLGEMAPWVDRFLLMESRTTFTGGSKPLVFDQNKAAFAAYADRIEHQIVDFPQWADSPWAREFYQRDAGLAALSRSCGPDDLVLVSDADEIIDRAAIDHFQGEYATLGMPLYAYFFNLRRTYRGDGTYGAVCRARYFARVGLSQIRLGLRRYSRKERLADAGWHFTSMKDAQGLFAKFQSYSHTEYASARVDHFAEVLERARRQGGLDGYERCDTASLPRVVRENLDKVGDYIL